MGVVRLLALCDACDLIGDSPRCALVQPRSSNPGLALLCLVCRFALQAGVATNLDNFQELERTVGLIADEPHLLQQQTQQPAQPHPRLIGLRINPQVLPQGLWFL